MVTIVVDHLITAVDLTTTDHLAVITVHHLTTAAATAVTIVRGEIDHPAVTERTTIATTTLGMDHPALTGTTTATILAIVVDTTTVVIITGEIIPAPT